MNEPDVRRVIRAIAEGREIDWAPVDPADEAPDPQHDILRELRVINQIAQVHRSAHDSAHSAEPDGAPACQFPVDAVSRETWNGLSLLDRIGRGSFGDVYRARDDRLEREVALKLLHTPAHAADGSRLIAEAGRLARIRHPNVVTVYGADRSGDRVGLWMELVRGRTLEQVLAEQGPLGPQEATLIGIDVCRGLAAVHRAGLVHRDLKAQNVMRESGGRIVLMDFGAGQPINAPATPSFAGTLPYLAPEVVSGNGSPATPRSDLYSLGVLIYHLVTGTYPVNATTLRELREAHQSGCRTHLRDQRPDLPDDFVQTVERALAPEPAARYESAGAMELALARASGFDQLANSADPHAESRTRRPLEWTRRRLVAVVAAAALAAALGGTAVWQWRTPATPHVRFAPRDWVLLAAFENRTRDRALDGVVEAALEHELVESQFVNVVPRVRVDDVLRLMKKPLNSRVDGVLGREVCLRDGGIRALITGRIEKIGPTYILSAAVVDPTDGRAVASVSEETTDLVQLTGATHRLSNRVRRALGEASQLIQQSDQQFEKVTTPSLTALRLYTDSYRLGDRGEWAAALDLVQQAVAEDREFAAAQIWLAWALYRTRHTSDEYLPVADYARSLVDRTTERERYWIVGSYHMLRGEPGKAATAYELLLRLHPDHRWALENLAVAYRLLGRTRDTLPLTVRLAAGQPHNAHTNWQAAYAAIEHGDFDGAEEYLARVRDLTNRADLERGLAFPSGYTWLFPAHSAWAMRRDAQTSLSELDQLVEHVGDLPPFAAEALLDNVVPAYYMTFGRLDQAREVATLHARPDWKPLTLAQAAFFAGDLPAARNAIRRVDLSPTAPMGAVWPVGTWLLARTGLVAEAARIVEAHAAKNPVDPSSYVVALRGEVALARGRVDESIALLREYLADTDILQGGGVMWRAAESLAEAYVRRGNAAEAEQVLKAAAVWNDQSIGLIATGLYRTSVRVRLVEVSRGLGHVDAIRDVEQDLSRQLAFADDRFTLVARLRTVGVLLH